MGEEYTPRSQYLILSGLQRHMRKVRPLDTINFFKDVHCKPLKNVCDSVFKQLHQKGIGTETKGTPVLSIDDEDELWKKVFDLDSPKGLLRAVFLCNGKNFCLHSGQEQRNLKISQLKRESIVVSGKNYTLTCIKNLDQKIDRVVLAHLICKTRLLDSIRILLIQNGAMFIYLISI